MRSAAAIVDPTHQFQPGEVWFFKTPASQPHAKLIILKVDNDSKSGEIVHIAVSHVSYGKGATNISHLPFARSSIEKSITQLEQIGPVPSFSDGYQIWREAFNAGKGGVFTISVADAIETVIAAAEKQRATQ